MDFDDFRIETGFFGASDLPCVFDSDRFSSLFPKTIADRLGLFLTSFGTASGISSYGLLRKASPSDGRGLFGLAPGVGAAFLENIRRPKDDAAGLVDTSKSNAEKEDTRGEGGIGFLDEAGVAGDGGDFPSTSGPGSSFLRPRDSGGGMEGLSM
jgi:hypothetical protein